MIVGFNFSKIMVERKKSPVKNLKVTYNIDFSDVREEKYSLKTKQKGVSFDFKFNIKYNPNFASINIDGTINYMGDEKYVGEILSMWKKKKKLPKEVYVGVVNLALDRCNVKALELSQDMDLPPHLPMPTVNVDGENPKDYIG